MRLVTKKSKALSRRARFRRSAAKRGIVIESAEGIRFAYADTPLPKPVQPRVGEKKPARTGS